MWSLNPFSLILCTRGLLSASRFHVPLPSCHMLMTENIFAHTSVTLKCGFEISLLVHCALCVFFQCSFWHVLSQ